MRLSASHRRDLRDLALAPRRAPLIDGLQRELPANPARRCLSALAAPATSRASCTAMVLFATNESETPAAARMWRFVAYLTGRGPALGDSGRVRDENLGSRVEEPPVRGLHLAATAAEIDAPSQEPRTRHSAVPPRNASDSWTTSTSLLPVRPRRDTKGANASRRKTLVRVLDRKSQPDPQQFRASGPAIFSTYPADVASTYQSIPSISRAWSLIPKGSVQNVEQRPASGKPLQRLRSYCSCRGDLRSHTAVNHQTLTGGELGLNRTPAWSAHKSRMKTRGSSER